MRALEIICLGLFAALGFATGYQFVSLMIEVFQ